MLIMYMEIHVTIQILGYIASLVMIFGELALSTTTLLYNLTWCHLDGYISR